MVDSYDTTPWTVPDTVTVSTPAHRNGFSWNGETLALYPASAVCADPDAGTHRGYYMAGVTVKGTDLTWDPEDRNYLPDNLGEECYWLHPSSFDDQRDKLQPFVTEEV